jgi:hypothetical protein
VLDDVFHLLEVVGMMALDFPGTARQREVVPFGQFILLDGLQPLFGLERIKASPALLYSDEAPRQLVECNAQQGRDSVYPRGVMKRLGDRPPGPVGPATLARHMVKGNVRELDAVCNRALHALAQAGVCGVQITGMADGTDLETTERSRACGQGLRKVRIEEKPGPGHESDVTVYGERELRLLDATTKMPLAVNVGTMHAHEPLGLRALVSPVRANLAGAARLHQIGFVKSLLASTALWWLDQQGRRLVVPATAKMAVTAEARAQAAAGAAPAPGADPGAGARVCLRLSRYLASGRRLAPGGGQAHRCAARHRHTSGCPGSVQAHAGALTLMLGSQRLLVSDFSDLCVWLVFMRLSRLPPVKVL